ncbi:MAG: hypothetical protein ABI534_07105 [Chloroflexota bacterium]
MSATLSPEFRARSAGPGTSVPDERELREALASIPEDFDWDWTRTRLVPLFERGGAEGTTGDPMINALTSLGVGIGFGVEIGPMLARVTRSMTQRWETSVEQIEHVAFENLQRAVADLDRRDLQPAVFNGHMMRALPNPQGWASSVILAGEAALTRIFGGHDQVFTTPTRNVLIAFDAQVPLRAVMDVTVALEELDPHPLMLEPFLLRDGRLSWAATVSDEELE